MGTWGLTGLDRLLCFMIVQELQNFLVGLQRHVLRDKVWVDLLAGLSRTLTPVEGILGMFSPTPGESTGILPRIRLSVHQPIAISPKALQFPKRYPQLKNSASYEINTASITWCQFFPPLLSGRRGSSE